MNNVPLETLKKAYAKAVEMGRTHVRFAESGATYYQNSGKNGAHSLQEIQDRIIDLDCPLDPVVFEDDEMPTDEEFGEMGFKFENGDLMRHRCGVDFIAIKESSLWDENQFGNWLVKSLVPRKNTGIQPCGDGYRVNVAFNDDGKYTRSGFGWLAEDQGWNLNHTHPITHWIPAKENFIKKEVNQSMSISVPRRDGIPCPIEVKTCPSDATNYVSGMENKLFELGYSLVDGEWVNQAEIDERNGREMYNEIKTSMEEYLGLFLSKWDSFDDEYKKYWIELAKQYTKK